MSRSAKTAQPIKSSKLEEGAESAESTVSLENLDDVPEYDEKLPFVERFRPNTLSKVLSHDAVISTLRSYLTSRRIPHLLLYGPPGTGKTSTIESFLRELYGPENYPYMVMNINASEERGIDVVRGKIKNFVNTKPIHITDNPDIPVYKFVILDEADAITEEAQGMLRIVIEKNTSYARFCLICNCIKKIDSAIQSRCKNFKFKPLGYESVNQKIDEICRIEGFDVDDGGRQMIWDLSKGDMRKVLHTLQVISMSYDYIDAQTVSQFLKYPSVESIDKVYASLRKDDLKVAIETMRSEKTTYSYSLVDMLAEISNRIANEIEEAGISLEQAIYLQVAMRDIEMNIISTAETDIQLASVVSAFIVARNM